MKRWVKNRINFNFSYTDFYNYGKFVTVLLENLNVGDQYCILLKINFNSGKYGMLGKHVGFKFDSVNDMATIEGLYQALYKRLEIFFGCYNVELVNSIQLLVVRIDDMSDLKIKNIGKVRFSRMIGRETFCMERFNFVPLTVKDIYFGKRTTNSIQLYKDRIEAQKFYINDDKFPSYYVDSLYLFKDRYIILNRKGINMVYRTIHNSSTGILIMEIKDNIISINKFVRKIENARVSIGNGRVSILNDSIPKI